MAGIIVAGTVPYWGISGKQDAHLLINSISFTPQLSEQEFKGMAGNVIGWMAYDQRIDWSISAGYLTGGLPLFASLYSIPIFGSAQYQFNPGIGQSLDITQTASICKTVETSYTSGEAMQVTLSGSIYSFKKARNCQANCDAGVTNIGSLCALTGSDLPTP